MEPDVTIIAENMESDRPVSADFTTAITGAATGMRKALVDLVASLPGGVRRPRDLERAMALDYNLAWSVFQVINASNIVGAANRIPKAPSIRRLLKLGEAKGLPGEVLNALRAASEQFERVVRVHAKNHITFNALVAGVSQDDGTDSIGLVERRNAFRSNTHIWGNQVDAYVVSFMVKKQEETNSILNCNLTARLGMKRFRASARTVAYQFRRGSPADYKFNPVDPSALEIGIPLMPEFCTQPLPAFRRTESVEFGICYELADQNVGQNSKVDLASGHIFETEFDPARPETRRVQGASGFYSPAAKMILDLVVHRPSFGKVSPKVEVVSLQTGAPKEMLPIRMDIMQVSGGIASASTVETPRYTEMLEDACQRLQWDASEFDIYRVAVDYPVLHSLTSLFFYF